MTLPPPFVIVMFFYREGTV